MSVKMSPGLLAQIREHGRTAYPHECCGFLLGRFDNSTKTVLGLKPAANNREDSPRNRYLISARDWWQTERETQAKGLDIVGIYHSHPDHPSRPSDYDREHALPGYSYVIVSVAGGEPVDLKSWRLRDDRSEFEAENLLTDCGGRD
jgi:proteasome lid subunit RPN8/RPN11